MAKPSRSKPSPTPAPVSASKSWLFSLIFVGLIAVLLVGLELLLQVTGAGVPTKPFKEVETWPGVYTDDANGFKKFYPKFASAGASDPIKQNIFQLPRPDGTTRGLVLGESTAQGFPFLKNQSWGKLASVALNRAVPKTDWEVLNLGRAAMSSYYVRDLAAKLPEYRPDFLVIYAGHNEYYGTVSQSTGSTHFLRNLYLSLKEWRTFQLLFEAVTPTPPRAGNTRMAQQFADHLIPASAPVDDEVAANFLDNLDTAVTPFLTKKLPVVLFQPVSNLGMPPFVTTTLTGPAKTALEAKLKLWSAALTAKDPVQALAYAQELAGQTDQPGVVFLQAATQALQTGHFDRALLERAKDLDPSPFRARSALVAALDHWAETKKAVFPSLIYVKTGAELEKLYGEAAYTGRLFIDHLHFNFEGQRAVARLMVDALAQAYHVEGSVEAAHQLLADDTASRQAVNLTGLWDYRAIHGVEKLLAAAPYSTMVLPADFGLAGLKATQPLYADANLVKALDASAEDDLFSTAMAYYNQRQDSQNFVANLFALSWINPGAAESHLLMGDFFARQPGKETAARDAYEKAYYLSGKNPGIGQKWQGVGGQP